MVARCVHCVDGSRVLWRLAGRSRVGESKLCQGAPPPKFDPRPPGSAWSPPATERLCRLRSERRGREVQRTSDSREEELTQIRRRTRSPPPGAQSILASVPFATGSQHEGGAPCCDRCCLWLWEPRSPPRS